MATLKVKKIQSWIHTIDFEVKLVILIDTYQILHGMCHVVSYAINHLDFLANLHWPCCSHKKKQALQMKKLMREGLLDPEKVDSSLRFLDSGITYCRYNESERVLGNTFSICILQVCNNSHFVFRSSFIVSRYKMLICKVFYSGLWGFDTKSSSENYRNCGRRGTNSSVA